MRSVQNNMGSSTVTDAHIVLPYTLSPNGMLVPNLRGIHAMHRKEQQATNPLCIVDSACRQCVAAAKFV